jgi:hypothetical protein
MHTGLHKRFGRLRENGSTEKEKVELQTLPFQIQAKGVAYVNANNAG